MGSLDFAQYRSSTYVTIPFGLVRALVQRKVGRNGWPVMVALCTFVYDNRTLGRMPAATICQKTGLTPWQVARGMTELRDKGFIIPVKRKTEQGYCKPDRSNTGHVARYCIAPDVWEMIELKSEYLKVD